MKLFRFIHNQEPCLGCLDGDKLRVLEKKGDGYGEETGETTDMSKTKILVPVLPSKVVALGLNYRDHAREMGQEPPKEPIIFLKAPSSVIGPDDPIIYPSGGITVRVDYEAELGIVIGKRCKVVKAEDAEDYIMGYTCVNDVTARDLQIKDGQWARAKSFDTFCPIGPCIETELDPSELSVQAVLNDKTVQDSSTKELIFAVPEIIEFVSRVMTLFPGDVIATGTPPGVGPLQDGDTITVYVEGIGRLTNQVQSE